MALPLGQPLEPSFRRFMIVLGVAVALIVEEKPSPVSEAPSWGDYLARLWHVFREDRVFRRFVFDQFYGLLVGGLAWVFGRGS